MIPRKLTHYEISEIISEVDYLLGTEGEIRNKINPTPVLRKVHRQVIKEVERVPEKRIIKDYDQYMTLMNFYKYLKESLYDKLSYIDLVPIKEARKDFARVIFNAINNSWIDPGQHLGAIAVDAIFEKYTQATLNTFHKTGSLYKIGSGVDRLIEILSAKKDPKFHSITAYFTYNYSYEELIKNRRYDLRELTFNDLLIDFFMETAETYFGINENGKIDFPDWYEKYKAIVENGKSMDLEGVFLRYKIDPYLVYLNRIDLKKIVNDINSSDGVLSLFSPVLKVENSYVIYFDIYPNKKTIKVDRIRKKVKHKFKPKKLRENISIWKEAKETIAGEIELLSISEEEKINELTEEMQTYDAKIKNVQNQLEKYSTIENIFDNKSIYTVYLQVIVSENIKNLLIRGINGLKGVYPQDVSIESVFQQVVFYKENLWILSLSRPLMKRKGLRFEKIINVLKMINLNPVYISDSDSLGEENYIPKPDDIDDENSNYPDAFVIFENNFKPETIQMFFNISNYKKFNIISNIYESVESNILNNISYSEIKQIENVPVDKAPKYFGVVLEIVRQYINELQEKPIPDELTDVVYVSDDSINLNNIIENLTNLLHQLYIDEHEDFKNILSDKFEKIVYNPEYVEEIEEIISNFVNLYDLNIQRYLIQLQVSDKKQKKNMVSKIKKQIEEDLLSVIDLNDYIQQTIFENVYTIVINQLQEYFDVFQYNVFISKVKKILINIINEWKEQSSFDFDTFFQLSNILFIKEYKKNVFRSKLDVLNLNLSQRLTENDKYIFIEIFDKEHANELIEHFDHFSYNDKYVFKIDINGDDEYLNEILNYFKYFENKETINCKKIINQYFLEDNMKNEENAMKSMNSSEIPKMTDFYKKTHRSFVDIDGSNIEKIFDELDVDRTQTYTNNMWKMLKIFGIDAVRNLIITELVEIGEANGLYIDPRYLAIIADTMTQNGNIRNLNYTTMKKSIVSILEAAGEQQPIKMLIAGIGMPTLPQRGGYELTGKEPPIGTAVFQKLEFLKAVQDNLQRGLGVPTEKYVDNDLENILTGESYLSMYEAISETEIVKKLVSHGDDDGTGIFDLLEDTKTRENFDVWNNLFENTILSLNDTEEFVNESMNEVNLTGGTNVEIEQFGEEFTKDKDNELFISPQQLAQLGSSGISQEVKFYGLESDLDEFDF